MRYTTVAISFASAIHLVNAYDAPPEAIMQFCGERKQLPHKVNGKWKCVHVSDLCDPDQDLGTLHQNRETGAWMCCPEDEILSEEGDMCKPHVGGSLPTCTDRIGESGLEAMMNDIFKDCFPGNEAIRENFVQNVISNLRNELVFLDSIYNASCPRSTHT